MPLSGFLTAAFDIAVAIAVDILETIAVTDAVDDEGGGRQLAIFVQLVKYI